MNLDKISKLNQELKKYSTITDKLNYWKIEYLDKYPGEALKDYFELEPDTEDGLSGVLKIPVRWYQLVPDLHKPEPRFIVERIEYCSWVLYYSAKIRFESISKPRINAELQNKLGIYKLEGDIQKIKKIQNSALKKLKDGELNIYDFTKFNNSEHLYIWYENDFYSKYEFNPDSLNFVEAISKHKYELPYLKAVLGKEDNRNPESIKINKNSNYNFTKLIDDLYKRQYFEEKESNRILEWLNGSCLQVPINIKKPMNHFASVIASLIENQIIENDKEDCYSILKESFTYRTKTSKINSIRNAMKPGDANRIKPEDKANYIDVLQYSE